MLTEDAELFQDVNYRITRPLGFGSALVGLSLVLSKST